MRRRTYTYSALLVASVVVGLAGCGSDKKESGAGGQTATYQASAACIGCHADNKLSPVTGVQIVSEWEKSAHNLRNGAACTNCHTNSGHPNGGSIVKAVQDTQCQTCHTPTSLGAAHFSPFASLSSAQYISQNDAAGVQCRKCHNPHDTTSLIQYNKDWADSGHGDITFTNDGSPDNNSVNSHYGWSNPAREACSKCHTTGGYVKHAAEGVTVLTTVTFDTNPASVVSTTTIGAAGLLKSNKRNEAIMCSACHDDYSWTRRAIGARTLEYTYDPDLVLGGGSDAFAGAAPTSTDGPTAPAAIVLPDVGDSNLCLVCHSGRGNFQSKRSTRFEGHHAATGADLFAATTHVGYEFTGRSYTKPAYFAHDTIGVSTGAGPCVSCHMKTTNSHKYEVVTKNGAGEITAINSQAVCNACHVPGGPYEMTPAKLEEEALGYKDAGKLLKDYLANTVLNYTGAPITVSSGNVYTIHVNTYGAFQNSLIITEDPGGFAHNRFYVKRLIFDSIDWLDNHAFGGKIEVNATTYPAAAKWFGAPATRFGNYTAVRP